MTGEILFKALVDELENDAGVGALAGDRIYPQRFPSGLTLPAIRYSQISQGRVYAHTGYSNLSHPRMQIEAAAETYGEARQLADAIIAALDLNTGTWGDDALPVSDCKLIDERDFVDEETGIIRIVQDWMPYHGEIGV